VWGVGILGRCLAEARAFRRLFAGVGADFPWTMSMLA
jgi:hypothetical protein